MVCSDKQLTKTWPKNFFGEQKECIKVKYEKHSKQPMESQ